MEQSAGGFGLCLLFIFVADSSYSSLCPLWSNTSSPLCGLQRIAHQHRDCQQSNSPGNGGSLPSDFISFRRMNIADQGIAAFLNRFHALISFRAEQLTHSGHVGELVHADVDYGRARFDEVATNKGRSANRGDENICLPRQARQIARLRMADGHSRMSLQQQTRDRSPNNLTATNDAGIRA